MLYNVPRLVFSRLLPEILHSGVNFNGSISYNNKSVYIKKRMAMATNISSIKPQHYDHFLVLDFEATCLDGQIIRPQEIIEFPVLMVNSQTLQTDSVFHTYVQPRIYPQLSTFCTELTGITQEMVDDKPHIEEVLKSFHEWMKTNLLAEQKSFIFVTCGDWDLKKMLPSQCQHFSIKKPNYFNKWINIKRSFAEVTGTYPKGMISMLDILQLGLDGRHHSGIDDSKNIARILVELLKKGHVFKQTGSLDS